MARYAITSEYNHYSRACLNYSPERMSHSRRFKLSLSDFLKHITSHVPNVLPVLDGLEVAGLHPLVGDELGHVVAYAVGQQHHALLALLQRARRLDGARHGRPAAATWRRKVKFIKKWLFEGLSHSLGVGIPLNIPTNNGL